MIRSHLASAILLAALVFASACTETQNRNNEHEVAPQVEAPQDSGHVSILSHGLAELSVSRGQGVESLRSFFESYLTPSFFTQLAQQRDPQELRDLTQYHRVFHQYSLDNPGEREALSQLSYDYYQRLIEVCANEFQTCPVLALYTHAVYAGNVFLLAAPLVADDERDRYNLFVTNIGYPQNNLPILEHRLRELVADISDDEQVNGNKIQQLINQSLYFSIESGTFPEQPIRVLEQMVGENPQEDQLRHSFESILRFALENDADGVAGEIAERYAKQTLNQTEIDDVLQASNDQGLIRWKGELRTFNKNTHWKAYYVLNGLLYPQHAGELYDYLFADRLASDAGQKEILDISLAYIYKKFVIEAYRSHQEIGTIWQEEFDRIGKVEPIFFDFFRKADRVLAEIWNVKYKREVNRIITEVTPFYSSEELAPLKQIENHLETNIRNIVAYPVQFIVGYFASRQGDFDFKFFALSGFFDVLLIHINDSYFFKEHFEGQAPVMFDFITQKDIEGLEALQSFYISLDQRILQAYQLDLSFTPDFVDSYVRKEVQFISDKEEDLNGTFSEGTQNSNLNHFCEKLRSGDNNFTYNLQFSQASNQFFKGQISHYLGGSTSFGTSRELLEYISVFNRQLLRHNMTESMEQLRMELGLKINRMKLLHMALINQGQSDLASEVSQRIGNVEQMADRFYNLNKENFLNMAQCLLEFDKVEEKMRIEYLNHELDFAKATYHVLQILNQDPEQSLSVEQAQQIAPQVFAKPFLDQLPESGDFLTEVNRVWLGLGSRYKNSIQGYQQHVLDESGFKKDSTGRYVFQSSAFEKRFRILHAVKNEKEGIEYPRSRITDLPRDFEELDRIFGHNQNHFYSFNSARGQTESQFVYTFMLHGGGRAAGHATGYFMDGQTVWRTLFLNMASMAKTRAFYLTTQDYNYSGYKNTLKQRMRTDFETLAEFTDSLVEHYNLSGAEKQILDEIQHHNFRRDDVMAPGGAGEPANTLFIYDNDVNFFNLGHYDVFFNVLVSYQLGLHPRFVPGLFGSGPQWGTGYDQNWLLWDWIPRAPQEANTGQGQVQQVDAEAEYGRRDQKYYALYNGRIARDFAETNLFDIDSRAQSVILHDLYQTVMADRGLIDAFVEWTQDRAAETPPTPYQMDLSKQPTPAETTYIMPSIRDRYYDFRHQFDNQTFNLFKNLETVENDEDGPQ